MIRQALADLLAFFILPGIIALMPCGFGARVSRWLSRRAWVFDGEARHTLAEAERVEPVADRDAWLQGQRFMRLRDQVDMYHWLIWGNGWLTRHADVQGAWPAAPFVSVTFHWGGGLWGLHSLRQATGGFAGVAAPPSWQDCKHRPVLFVYARLRTWVTARLLGDGLVQPGRAAMHLVRKLRAGTAICGLWDSPARPGDKSIAVILRGRQISLPRGLPAMASREGLPLVLFHGWTDVDTGRIQLRIENLGTQPDEVSAAATLAARLDALVTRAPHQWHHWYLLNLPSPAN